ncbi:helix-turn-helix transcriptional regulator [Pseudonocardia sp. RS11V-5]|uniref:helix-turn-helix transcriptional regulator n=1 Tax=Pseudonocardia terrae TaxID=2905831 RepID=UPI001E2E5801|nr:helix-turn-helix transcriptional regulator [Pseudonocardia terrae]MCE3555694.1 helix-turn-helix transcriptional regulator [Pseudonocardia terrae]
MDNRAEIREFLVSRRAKVTPEQVGLPAGGGTRRVPGLRREEVAVLAGVSTDWYVRLEKGHISGVSDDVLDAVARALQLDEAERAHLFDLARAARPARPGQQRRRGKAQLRPSVARIVDSMTTTAAFVRNGRLDLLAINALGRALYSPVFDAPARPANLARFNFLDPRARDFYPDWDDAAHTSVALLHTEAGRDPHDRDLTDLVGELATRSPEFRTLWAGHDVRLHNTGTKKFHHPVVGRLELTYEGMALPADPGLTLTAYTAEPGSPSEDALRLLASWAATIATEDDAEAADLPDHTAANKDR